MGLSATMFKNRRVYLLATVAYMGAFLFGYDTGVMGSVLTLNSFKNDFGLPKDKSGFTSPQNAHVSANVVSLLTAGAFFGAIFASVLNDRFGRKKSLIFYACIFLIGAAMQTGAHHAIGLIYGGRVVAGFGIGGMTSITPVFVSENAPANVRGRIAGLFQEFIVVGVMISYWLDYGVSLHIHASTKQWRIPVALQMVPGGVMLIGLFFLHESPRWLMKQGKHEAALESLAYMRCEEQDSVDILAEMAEIRAQIDEEIRATNGVTWRECLKPGTRIRFSIGFLIMFWQQFSGTNSIGYYAPQIFQTVGLSKTEAPLFATGIYGTVKVIATGVFLIIGIDKFGRRPSLLCGAAWMASMMFIIGSVLATHPPDTRSTNVSSASIGMVTMIYLYVIGYSMSWGPVPWVYVSEIFPTRLRSYGVALAAATQWLFNFVITQITPAAVNGIGWRTFLMFGIFCLAMGVYVFFFIKETKGRTLESMDILFGAVDEETRVQDLEQAMETEKQAVGIEHHEFVETHTVTGKQ